MIMGSEGLFIYDGSTTVTNCYEQIWNNYLSETITRNFVSTGTVEIHKMATLSHKLASLTSL